MPADRRRRRGDRDGQDQSDDDVIRAVKTQCANRRSAFGGYSIPQAGYDLRKLRGKRLVDKPGRIRRYHVPPLAARAIAALLTLRDRVIAPILAAVRSPHM
jgi:hypothetical protein